MARVPTQAALAAQTDQYLAQIADERTTLGQRPGGELTGLAADRTARLLAVEFPDTPELGRIVVSVASALLSVGRVLTSRGVTVDASGLLSVAGLTGEQLHREACEEVPGLDEVSALWGVRAFETCPTTIATRTRNGLVRGGIRTVADLLACDEERLRGLREFGAGCIAETRRALAARGLALKGEEVPGDG